MRNLITGSVVCLLLSLWTGSIFAEEIALTWESMADHYKVPQWFEDGKIGVWTHWGVPSATDESRPNDGSLYGRRMYRPNEGESGGQLEMTKTLAAFHAKRYGPPSAFGYENLVPLSKAENWDPVSLVKFFKDNGARFVMPVACHHDNFDMYDSFHPWNSMDMGPKRDTPQEWKAAATEHGLKFGISARLYWSPCFFNTARKYQTPGTVEAKLFNLEFDPKGYASQDSWNEHWYARCWEIIEKYDPDMFNNDAPFPSEKAGKSLGVRLFSSYVNRDLKENNGKQTAVFSCKSGNLNRKAFTYNLERGGSEKIQPKPWMWATDLSGGWYYRKGADNRMSVPVMIGNTVDAISKNRVVMMNVALRGDGTIPENQAAYLTAFGGFLNTCGEGIYGTRPWKTFGEGPTKIKDGRQGENHRDFTQNDIRFTTKDGLLFAFVLGPPTKDIVIKTLASEASLDGEIGSISMMGADEEIQWNRNTDGLTIQLPKTLPNLPVIGFKLILKKLANPKPTS
ncbi:alpha-L-fucosidase [Rhodopirellula sp. SWK7]|uniref:alpha-L-fucosidase n=1 Tax=Rhodopirellula sp. SWK7 TaxID=595460 RepID=UPI0002BF3BDD|nr:alpha-L-fucosidase [Rhodopirellula sp. SWK7]EMI43328.1 Glycoside hydrolase, family 29 [Rhodopirellula sp. SWK7]